MHWHDKNTTGGQLVAAQTTHGDYKDLFIISHADDVWYLISLQDGYCNTCGTKDSLIERLNEHRFAPITKIIGSGPLPENRAGLPTVQITGLRHSP